MVNKRAQVIKKGPSSRRKAPATKQRSIASTPAAGEPGLPFPVVGVGASAGGLEASTLLLKALPKDTGMAFVLVHHLSPDHTSMLPEILSRATHLPVQTIEDDMVPERDHVYVIPPNSGIELTGGVLKLVPRDRVTGAPRPIDHFFQSLAAEQTYSAIGVILSGTANDGTAGCKAIKAEGGITFAQDESAQQDSMPRSAITAGGIDFVLPPEEIARELIRIGKHPLVKPQGKAVTVEESQLEGILEAVRQQTGVDFSYYKRSTLLRRIGRRMVLHHLAGIKDYHVFLKDNPGERDALFQDVLINVTSFFRNPEGFELLKERVFPEVAKNRSKQAPIRIWVLGCSTGEEAYSVAMAFSEFATGQPRASRLQVFASDLSPQGIEKARMGFYSKAIEQDVSPDRLRRFFTEADGGYRIVKPIRDMVIFARHNALTDPPFSSIDLITCRNVLIYLDSVLQQQLIPTLHYALSPGGFLWLGSSESVGTFRTLFDAIDSKQKLYQRKPTEPIIAGRVRRESVKASSRPQPKTRETPVRPSDPLREADRLLLSRYAPPGVLVNQEFQIQLIRGDTAAYLTPAQGRASHDLLKMLREDLVVGTRDALLKAKKENRPIRQEGLTIQTGDSKLLVSVEVIPVASQLGEAFYLILFDDVPAARARARPARTAAISLPKGRRAAAEVLRLHGELVATREYLQSVIEQQDAANEELQSANEEVQSANEELQSINEELETSKEEIQSSSEELATVNDELTTRNLELGQTNSDLFNLISSVGTPIVILGPDFRIRRFTPTAERVLNLIPTDLGRPITDIRLNFDLPDLDRMLGEVMQTMASTELVVQGPKGRRYSLRLSPYRTLENLIDGVVMMLVDITAMKDAEDSIRRNMERLAIFQGQAPLGIREVDAQGHYLQVNDAYCAITGFAREELLGRPFQDFLPPEDRGGALEFLRRVMAGEIVSYREERHHVYKGGKRIWVEVHGYALRDEQGHPTSAAGFVQDISERKQVEADLRAADRSKNEFLAMLAHELRNPLAPLLNTAHLLAAPNLTGEAIGSLRGILDRQIRNLARMTDDLLDVSRISRGRIRLQPEVVDLVAVTSRAVDLFRPTIEGRGQELLVELPSEPIYFDADPVRLEQIIDNLLANASKFVDHAGKIWFSLRRIAEPAPGVAELAVRDNGRGISGELMPFIFDPFVQAEQTMDRTRGGLGIGLTLVRHLVQLHGGTVTVQSEGTGRGAEFVVRLPLAAAPRFNPPDRRKSDQMRRHRRILIVDDNPDAADTLGMLLRHEGHEVAIANEGDSAIQMAGDFKPDIALLDMGLPGKDGIEVARLLRARQDGGPPHLVAVSGYGQEELRARAREVGIEHYFTKPVDIANLVRLFAGLS